MGRINCVIRGCNNSTYREKKWLSEVCDFHSPLKRIECQCQAPVRIYTFPSKLRNKDKRESWIKLTGIKNPDGSAWEPGASHGVCAVHFVDKIPTCANPNPTLLMGEGLPQKRRRKKVIKKENLDRATEHSLDILAQVAAEVEISKNGSNNAMSCDEDFVGDDHDYINLLQSSEMLEEKSCVSCIKWKCMFHELLTKNSFLENRVSELEQSINIMEQHSETYLNG